MKDVQIFHAKSPIKYLVNIPRRVEICVHPVWDKPRWGKALDILLFDRWNVNIVFWVMFYRFPRER